MSSFPLTVQKYMLSHEQGTKDYDIIVVGNNKDQAILVTRWGRVATTGQMQVEFHKSWISALDAAQKKMREKCSSSHGYKLESQKKVSATNPRELTNAIGIRFFFNLGSGNLMQIAPEIDWVKLGVKNVPVPSFEVIKGDLVYSGYKPQHTPPPADPTEEELEIIKQEKNVERVAANSLWGSW